VLTSRFDLPWEAGLFSSGAGEVVVFTDSTDDPPETRTPVRIERTRGRPSLGDALAWLREKRDVKALLSEGGPSLHAALLGAGLVDELFITTAATVVGGAGPTILEGLGEADRPVELRWLLRSGGELFARYALGAAD
ncbi:MAG: RibD family protein, partial [Solirubrobacterales bacterium]